MSDVLPHIKLKQVAKGMLKAMGCKKIVEEYRILINKRWYIIDVVGFLHGKKIAIECDYKHYTSLDKVKALETYFNEVLVISYEFLIMHYEERTQHYKEIVGNLHKKISNFKSENSNLNKKVNSLKEKLNLQKTRQHKLYWSPAKGFRIVCPYQEDSSLHKITEKEG